MLEHLLARALHIPTPVALEMEYVVVSGMVAVLAVDWAADALVELRRRWRASRVRRELLRPPGARVDVRAGSVAPAPGVHNLPCRVVRMVPRDAALYRDAARPERKAALTLIQGNR